MNALLILGIETSGKTASVALCDENKVIAQNTIYTKLTHSQVILPLCRRLLSDANTELSQVDRIAVSAGPGSYTGLRIGIAAVKAMGYALGKECVGISALESLAYNEANCGAIICSLMKARLDLVYTASFTGDIMPERLTDDRILSEDELLKELSRLDKTVMLTGDAAEDFFEKYGGYGFLRLAPAHLRLQLASSLCFCAVSKEGVSPDALEACYLQATKAEQDLINK